MFLRFLLVGGTGFVIDAGITFLLIRAQIPPWLARIPAVAVAMTFTWLANRRFTYEVGHARSAAEALRYVLVAIAMALINYMIYLGLVAAGMSPVAAVAVATGCQTVLSFQAYRVFVFGVRR